MIMGWSSRSLICNVITGRFARWSSYSAEMSFCGRLMSLPHLSPPLSDNYCTLVLCNGTAKANKWVFVVDDNHWAIPIHQALFCVIPPLNVRHPCGNMKVNVRGSTRSVNVIVLNHPTTQSSIVVLLWAYSRLLNHVFHSFDHVSCPI